MDIRLLIVDDHRGVREALRYVFAVAGIEQLEEATTCEEALCMLEREFDLLLLDIGLPDGNGLDLLQQIKAIDPAAPVLIHSLHDSPLHLSRGFHLGASGYLIKGEDKNALIAAVRCAAAGGSAWTKEQLTQIRQTDAEFGHQVPVDKPVNEGRLKQTV